MQQTQSRRFASIFPKAFLLPFVVFALIFSSFPQVQNSGIPLGIGGALAAKAPDADLVVSSVSNPPATAELGSSFDVTDTTENTGTGAAKPTTTAYRLSIDANVTSSDPLLTGNRSVPRLNAGETSSGTVTVTDLPPKNWTIFKVSPPGI